MRLLLRGDGRVGGMAGAGRGDAEDHDPDPALRASHQVSTTNE